MTAYVDTNVLVRHLVGSPDDLAQRATNYLQTADRLLLPDVVFAEVVFVLGSVYGLGRRPIAWLMRAVLGFPAIAVADARLLVRSLELYEQHRVGFADAYLVASAESTGIGAVASFDRDIDRPGTVERIEPPA